MYKSVHYDRYKLAYKSEYAKPQKEIISKVTKLKMVIYQFLKVVCIF